MRQASETNIIVLNTALKYIKYREKKHKYTTTHKHGKKSQCKSQRSIARRERLKAFTGEKLIISHGKLFQTLITRSERNTDRVTLLQRRLNNL